MLEVLCVDAGGTQQLAVDGLQPLEGGAGGDDVVEEAIVDPDAVELEGGEVGEVAAEGRVAHAAVADGEDSEGFAAENKARYPRVGAGEGGVVEGELLEAAVGGDAEEAAAAGGVEGGEVGYLEAAEEGGGDGGGEEEEGVDGGGGAVVVVVEVEDEAVDEGEAGVAPGGGEGGGADGVLEGEEGEDQVAEVEGEGGQPVDGMRRR